MLRTGISLNPSGLVISTAAQPRVTIDNSGAVVINAASSGDTLTVKGTLNGANIQTWTDGTNTVGLFGATGLTGFGTTSNTGLSLYTHGTARIAIDNAGLQTTFTAGGAGQFRVSLTQAGTADGDLSEIQLSSGASALALFVANTNLSTAIITGGPTGTQGVIRTLSASPLVFGVSNHIICEMSGSTTTAAIAGWGPNATTMVDMAPDTCSYTGTLTGCLTAPTGTIVGAKSGNVAVLTLPGGLTATSNATSCTITGALPANFQPARNQNVIVSFLEDNGTVTHGTAEVTNGTSTITLFKGDSNSGASWTAGGTKGVASTCSFTYMLN